MHEHFQHRIKHKRVSVVLVALIFLAGLLIGALAAYYVVSQEISSLKEYDSKLNDELSRLSSVQGAVNETINIYQNGTNLSQLYSNVDDSVVLLRSQVSNGTLEGSGFVYNFSGSMLVITNHHVVAGTLSTSVTFADGDGYEATVKGSDPYADLAVVSVNAPQNEFKPLTIVSSSELNVGDLVIAIGNPYGLMGSMTTGVVSALGRSFDEGDTGGYPIANVIQTSAPINPGNSGGPLMNYRGEVIGITTAVIQGSEGLGFAIPSDSIVKEVDSLINIGTYDGHSDLGAEGVDMTYEDARRLGISTTYGWQITSIAVGGPSYGKLSVNDVITAMNGTRVRNGDDLASYLEAYTLPEDIVTISVVRGTQTLSVNVVLARIG